MLVTPRLQRLTEGFCLVDGKSRDCVGELFWPSSCWILKPKQLKGLGALLVSNTFGLWCLVNILEAKRGALALLSYSSENPETLKLLIQSSCRL